MVTSLAGWVAPFGDRGINARSRLPHAFRSYATSFFGTQRQGIHPTLILSSHQRPVVNARRYDSRNCFLVLRLQRYVLVKVLAALKRYNVITFKRSDAARAFTPEA